MRRYAFRRQAAVTVAIGGCNSGAISMPELEDIPNEVDCGSISVWAEWLTESPVTGIGDVVCKLCFAHVPSCPAYYLDFRRPAVRLSVDVDPQCTVVFNVPNGDDWDRWDWDDPGSTVVAATVGS